MWIYDSIVEQYINMAGKYEVRILLKDDIDEQSIFMSFREEPTLEIIQLEAEKKCFELNNPRPLPRVIREEEFVEKETLLATKEILLANKEELIIAVRTRMKSGGTLAQVIADVKAILGIE